MVILNIVDNISYTYSNEISSIVLEVGGVSQVSPDAQPGHRFVSFVRAGEARRGEAA